MKKIVIIGVMLALTGCGAMQQLGVLPERQQTGSAAMGAGGATAAALDTTTEAEKVAALVAPAAGGERELGRVVVALGSPAEQGIWLKTALVSAVTPGRVVTAGGQSLAVELRPGSGAALLSLAAFQALGLKLTELPEVTVFGP